MDISDACAQAGEPATTQRAPSPWLYIITLYYPFGLLQAGLAMQLPGNLLKLLGYTNVQIGLISGIGIVASIRFVFAPWLDGLTTKRKLSIWTLTAGGLCALLMALATWAAPGKEAFFWIIAALLFGVAFVNAAHETAADGYYIRALDRSLQAQFIGVKTASIRIGIISASTGLLLLATKVAESYGAAGMGAEDKTGFYRGFALAFMIAGAVILLIAFYNSFMIPKIDADQPVRHERFALLEVLRDYFSQHRVWLIVVFIVFYRFGEGFLVMKYPFYLDPLESGGLGTRASDLAYLSLLAEMPWMIIGGLLGGYLIKWFGLKRVFIPLALCISLPTLLFYWLSVAQPTATVPLLGQNINIALLFSSALEAAGYGASFSAMFFYMHIMASESGRNKTSILAISFAVMNLGWYIPGILSGYLQTWFGYPGLFLISTAIGLIPLVLIPFLPMPRSEQRVT